jgi:hypothetical protein
VPTLREFLLAPWKIIGALFSGTGQVTAPAPQVTPIAQATKTAAETAQTMLDTPAHASSLCYPQNVGDQVLNICQVLGYEMPSFVFWASLLIFALFVFTCVTLLHQCSQLSRVFARLAHQISKLPQGEQLHAIRNLMAKNHLTQGPWRRFDEGLIVSAQGDEVFTPVSIEEAFPKSSMIEENVHGQFFSAVPGILTGLGLLMTFIAILDGLSHVSVTANMDVKGIGGLINGLSGKFVSSITAVTCAVAFVFVERIAYAQPQQAYRRLVEALSQRFKRKTTEHLLYQLQKELMTQAAVQRELAQTLRTTPGSEANRGRR